MKIIVDKIPDFPEQCLFSTHSRNAVVSYTACKLNKNRKCEDTSKCSYLKQNVFGKIPEVQIVKNSYTPIDYQCEAMRTADPNLDDEKSLLEGLIGLNSEAGEALDIYKKHIFQNHDLDREKIALELGDALWYLTEAADAISYTLTDIMKMNIQKLQRRYPDGFDPERSRNREV